MGFAKAQACGWRVCAENTRNAPTAARARWYQVPAVGLAPRACIVITLVAIAAFDSTGAEALLNRFAAIHVFLGAGVMALGLYAGLSLISGVGSLILAIAETLPQFVAGGAMMAALPFAQATDPAGPKSASDDAVSRARSEMQIGLYAGGSKSPPSDVRLVAPDGTDILLKDVVWKSQPFKPSPYYGGRGVDWNTTFPNFGLMVDFTHAKATAIRSQIVNQTGKRSGVDVPPREPFDKTFRKLEFTHGLNMLTFNGVFRITGVHRRLIPYAGLGIGFLVPHAEAWRAGEKKADAVREAQVTGMALQALGGIEWRIFKSGRRSVFTEYKFAHAPNVVKLHTGGTVSTKILVHQFVLGGYFTPWRKAAPAGN
ncbi:MAG: hypothetical protein MPJ78_18845 [Hyphomicrobiaceae bacterium]|nr:hypothetical protein [Hyphomicrobiaceae bacterium]